MQATSVPEQCAISYYGHTIIYNNWAAEIYIEMPYAYEAIREAATCHAKWLKSHDNLQ